MAYKTYRDKSRSEQSQYSTFRRGVGVFALACIVAVSARPGIVFGAKPKASFHIEEATISDIQSAITSKQITTVDVVNLYLVRIKTYNGACVAMPDGLLGPISTIPHAGQLNALGTLNLRPATRRALTGWAAVRAGRWKMRANRPQVCWALRLTK